jgi:hypothetical protein
VSAGEGYGNDWCASLLIIISAAVTSAWIHRVVL